MTRIAPVHLAYNPKTLWFDAGELKIDKDDHVVVETARGVEFGTMASAVFEATEENLAVLKAPLKPVIRVATPEDVEAAKEMEVRSRDALLVFRELAAKHNEDMHPVAVEFLIEGDKAVFYFEAEDRLDFRDIVRDLASRFNVRVDMRQIGVRDEARMVGGLGHCGQELCCKRLGGEFCPVSIRMAKEQGLSLNPQKISGVCGRLMCCLRYEYEAYKDFHSRAPKQNSTVQTPDGPAKVCSLDAPREIVDLRIEIDGKHKTVHVPLADMEPPEEGSTRPRAVGEKAWREAIEPPLTSAAAAMFLTSQFTGNDKLSEARAVRRNNANVKNATGSTSMVEVPKKQSSRRRRRGGDVEAAPDTTRLRRRRSTTVTMDATKAAADVADGSEEGRASASDGRVRETRVTRRRSRVSSRRGEGDATGPSVEGIEQESRQEFRPGRRSSGLSKAREASREAYGERVDGAFEDRVEGRAEMQAPKGDSEGSTRRRRRRGGSGRKRGEQHAVGHASEERGSSEASEAPSSSRRRSSSGRSRERGVASESSKQQSAAGAGQQSGGEKKDASRSSSRRRRRRRPSNGGEGKSNEA